GLVGRSQVCRSAQEPGDTLRQHVQHFAGRFTSGDTLRVSREEGQVTVPPGRQFAPLHLLDLGRQGRVLVLVGPEEIRPAAPGLGAPLADAGREVLVYAVGHEKLRVFGPDVGTVCNLDLV